MTKQRYKNLDEKYMGLEPIWDSVDELTPEVILNNKIESAIRWYSHFYDFKESLKFINQFYKKQKVSTKNLKKITPLDTLEIGRIVGFLCRMKLKGLNRLTPKYNDLLAKKLTEIERIGSSRKKVIEENKEPVKVISVQQRVKDKANSLMFDLDYVIELFIDNGFETNFKFDVFQNIHTIKKPVALKMIPQIEERISEIENKEGDIDLKEAYRHLTTRQKNKIIKLLKECKTGCQKITLIKQKRKRKKVL